MIGNRKIRTIAGSLLLHVAMLCAAVVTIIPFVWMVGASFMKTGEAGAFPPKFLPDTIVFDQYRAK